MTDFIRGTDMVVEYEQDFITNSSSVIYNGRKYPFPGSTNVNKDNIKRLLHEVKDGDRYGGIDIDD